jgi:4'-phosphopantetheinyl transferase
MCHLRNSLSPDELDRAAKFHFLRDSQRFIAARGILRNILSRYIGQSPETIRFSYGPFGKPRLAPSCAADGLRFNLSHAGNIALYAVALNREIGVDLERIDPSFLEDRIEEKFFSRNEIVELRSLPVDARPRAFFNCWTRKEAYVKALGGGLQTSLQSFDVSLAPGKAPDIFQPFRRYKCAASRQVMKSARLERMLLHSFATSMVTPGTKRRNPCRETGVPTAWKMRYAISVEACCKARMTRSKATSGNGTISSKNKSGKAAARNALNP